MTTTTLLTNMTTASGELVPSDFIKSDSLGRIHVSKEHREQLLNAFDASGMSGAKFARHYGLKYPTFASWIQKRRRERNKGDKASRKSSNSLLDSLAEVTLEKPTLIPAVASNAAPLITLKLPGGSSLDIGSPEQAQIAAALLNNLNTSSHA